MESSELAIYRGLGEVRNYGIAILIALLFLNGAVLFSLKWAETSDLHNELVKYAEALPAPDANKTTQMISLPEDIIVFHSKSETRGGFYETSIGNQEYLAYADPKKHYVLMKSEAGIQKEIISFALALVALYAGEVVLLVGWWFFIRSKVREIFELV